MLNELKKELRNRNAISESQEIDDDILIDEMDDDILLSDEDELVTESSVADIERAIELIPVDETDIAYEEMDELLEACCSKIEESTDSEAEEKNLKDSMADGEAIDLEIKEEFDFNSDYFGEEFHQLCDEEDDCEDYNNYHGHGASHAGGYCEEEEDLLDEEDELVEDIDEEDVELELESYFMSNDFSLIF